jgi:hypothetical protein
MLGLELDETYIKDTGILLLAVNIGWSLRSLFLSQRTIGTREREPIFTAKRRRRRKIDMCSVRPFGPSD